MLMPNSCLSPFVVSNLFRTMLSQGVVSFVRIYFYASCPANVIYLSLLSVRFLICEVLIFAPKSAIRGGKCGRRKAGTESTGALDSA